MCVSGLGVQVLHGLRRDLPVRDTVGRDRNIGPEWKRRAPVIRLDNGQSRSASPDLALAPARAGVLRNLRCSDL